MKNITYYRNLPLGNVTNVFGSVVGQATKPTEQEENDLEYVFSLILSRYPEAETLLEGYKEHYYTHTNKEYREGFIQSLKSVFEVKE